MIQFIRLVLEDLLLHVLPFLNAGNLCQLKFVNNEDLPNTGNLDFTLRQGGRGRGGWCLQGNLWYSPPSSMTSRLASVTFKMASKVFIEETDKSRKYRSDFLDLEILRFLLP